MKHPEIPSFIYRIFQWFCKDSLFEELEGDLEEKFLINREKYGLRKARRIYTFEVLKMIRPTILKRKTSGPSYQVALIASYSVLAFRNLKKHKLFSFINIFSLSVAMSAGLLVIGMITDLLKFDTFHTHKDEIYRVISTPYHNSQQYKTQATSPLMMGDEMLAQIPGIQITRLGRRLIGEAKINEKKLLISGIYADEHFFDFLDFDLLKGDPGEALKDPFSIVVAQNLVNKVFEDTNPIGKTIAIEGFGTYTITGVVADPPRYSHLQFEIIGSISTVHARINQGQIPASQIGWEDLNRFYNYIYIPGNLEKASVNNWLRNATTTYYKEPEKMHYTFELQGLLKILPGPNISDSIGLKMIHLPVIIFAVIATAILLSAIFNYTNLSMARALRRAREVGVRKLNGASSSAIFLQFTLEAIILSLLSLGLGILLFIVLKPEFISIVPRANQILSLDLNFQLVGSFIGFAIITGLIAGLAPSIFFARLSSLKSLRSGTAIKSLSKINFRKGLIVTQFTLSIIFVLAISITSKLHNYLLNYEMGFEKENILNISLMDNDPELIKAELMKLPEVSDVSFSSFIPGIGNWGRIQLVDSRNQDSVWVATMNVDHTYLENMQIELIAGRNFYPDENTNQEQSMLVNETFLRNFGLGEPLDAIGTTFSFRGNLVEIVGVIKDFHFANLEEKIDSFIFRSTGFFRVANIKIVSNDVLGSYKKVETVWDTIDEINRMEGRFFDAEIEEYYQILVDIMKMFGFIGFLAISISCLGLFGMTIYSTEIRLKEIGIRKTFGASEKTLVFLLSKGFLKLVIWAIIIGIPICYYVFDTIILEQYYYRIDISFLEIAQSISFLLFICLATIITQTWSAARTNPSEVLRNE